MGFLGKNLEFFRIDEGSKFTLECVPNGIISLKCLFRPNYEVFWQENQKNLNVRKIRKYDEERVIFRGKRYHLLKVHLYQIGKAQNMPVAAGCFVTLSLPLQPSCEMLLIFVLRVSVFFLKRHRLKLSGFTGVESPTDSPRIIWSITWKCLICPEGRDVWGRKRMPVKFLNLITRLLSQHVCEACGQTIPSTKDIPGPSKRK